jgi:DNA polymerase-3 subunit alpha
MDGLGGHRAQLASALGGAIDRAQKLRLEKERGQVSLFADTEVDRGPPELPPATPWPRDELLRLEKDTLGFFVSGHPLSQFARELRSLTTTTAEGLDHVRDGEELTIGGIVLGVRRQFDRQGRTMARLALEDFTGSFTCLVFARLYQDAAAVVEEDARLLISGRASVREGERAVLLADSLRPLADAMRGLDLHVRLETESTELSLDRLKQILEAHPGRSRVVVHISRSGAEGSERSVIIRLRNILVDPEAALVDDLKDILGDEAVWLAGERGKVGVNG